MLGTMKKSVKASQLQVRVSAGQKRQIQRAADAAGLDMSAYVLARVIPTGVQQFQERVAAVKADPRFALAELNTFLTEASGEQLREAIADAPAIALSAYLANYVAAMVELACARAKIPAPGWTRSVAPLEEPVFASALENLRLHLLTQSPPPFRRRNLFIDASLGARV